MAVCSLSRDASGVYRTVQNLAEWELGSWGLQAPPEYLKPGHSNTSEVTQVSLSEFCFSLILSQKQLKSRLLSRSYAKKRLKVQKCKKMKAKKLPNSKMLFLRKIPILLPLVEPAVCPEHYTASSSLWAHIYIFMQICQNEYLFS